MAIVIESHVTGSQLATALASETEEFAYALEALVEDNSPDELAQQVSEFISYGRTKEIVDWLRSFTIQLEKENEA